jgi:hypothetical protein
MYKLPALKLLLLIVKIVIESIADAVSTLQIFVKNLFAVLNLPLEDIKKVCCSAAA